jgi:hypothetical protein
MRPIRKSDSSDRFFSFLPNPYRPYLSSMERALRLTLGGLASKSRMHRRADRFPEPASMKSQERPLSPHLQIYRWQLTSVLSILHRATGLALVVGSVILVWWLAAAADPPRRVKPAGDAAAKGGTWPFGRVLNETVLHWIEVNVVHMRHQIPVVADRVLPVSPLPDAALAAADHHR